MSKLTGSQLLVKCLEAQGVEYIFGIPGAKIDSVFDALLDSSIELIVCRHEQNAAFIAAAYGRLTKKPGVVLVTSGPGVANLATGLLTATTEGDPVIAIGGNVPQSMELKQSHQGTNNVKLMEAVTKKSVEAHTADNIPEIIENAFRIALQPTSGACFISVPQDVLGQTSQWPPIPVMPKPSYGQSPDVLLDDVATLINQAEQPVIFLGMESSRSNNTAAIRALLEKTPFAVVSTYQAAGVISKELLDCFIGRVGLFKNQPGDQILDGADVVLTIGYNPVEYDPEIWNSKNDKTVIHLDYAPCDIHNTYHPVCEVLGDIAMNIQALSTRLKKREEIHSNKKIMQARQELLDKVESGKTYKKAPIHPLRFIYELTQVVNDETTVCCDIGTVYMWMSRYFFSYRPHHLLFSNGQQTLGVALPWAIATNFACPNQTVISISGDGGFLFSAMELETAVREGLKFVHFIWRDGSYNMVLEQELMKYHRKSGVDFGVVNIPDFAASFGALGLELHRPEEFKEIFHKALNAKKPVLVDVPIDYSDNAELFKLTDPKEGH
ncbi:acetolactate synthase AlsS [Legionella yabuuchiae]|uniref:acetolactate synthase AlsS n=1 Tax=Legionella yabuuchiae TaxID=376727 RepID=UPI00105632E6|nr:acetolactate synthase AlsS [Legionella yabuuchiae]